MEIMHAIYQGLSKTIVQGICRTFRIPSFSPRVHVTIRLEPMMQWKTSTWAAVNFKKHVTLMISKPEPAMWSHDTGKQIPCFDSCQLIITRMSNIIRRTILWKWCYYLIFQNIGLVYRHTDSNSHTLDRGVTKFSTINYKIPHQELPQHHPDQMPKFHSCRNAVQGPMPRMVHRWHLFHSNIYHTVSMPVASDIHL